VEKEGFNKWLHENFTVQVRADVTVNTTLAVGEVSQQVTVTGAVSPLKFNTSSVDLTIDRKMLTDLPILGRNPKLNARPNATVFPPEPSFVRNHNWGGTLGNPIIKNKLFAFTAWEQWRTKDPRTLSYTMPTDAERAGDFSKSLNAEGNLRTIYDPWTTREDPAHPGEYIRDPFQNNIIPPDRIDSTTAKMMQDIWKPNNPGIGFTGRNNFKESYQWTTNYWNFSERTDWNINDKWRVFGRYSQFHNIIGENHTVDSRAMPYDEGGAMYALNIAGDAVYTMNEHTIINFRGSYGSIHDDYYSAKGQVSQQDLSGFWPSNWFEPYISDMPNIYYPRLNLNNGSDDIANFGHRELWFEHPKNLSASFKMFQYMGRHNVKYGVSYRRNYGFTDYPAPMAFNFRSQETANTFQSPDTTLSGDPWASLLLGSMYADPSSQDGSNAQYVSPWELSHNSWALYIHDDFKVTANLTLNIGLRWEYETAPVDAQDRLSRFLDLSNPIPEMQGANAPVIPPQVTDIVQIPYKWNGAWVFSSPEHPGMFNTRKDGFMPRLGFAYRINDKTSLRGGYARFVIPPSLTQPNQWSTDETYVNLYGYSAQTYTAGLLNRVPRVQFSDPFPAQYPLTLPSEKKLGRYQQMGDTAIWTLQDMKTGVSDRFNVSFQHMLPGSFAADVTYYLNFGSKLPYFKQVNMMDPRLSYQYKGQLDDSVPNPFFNYLTPDKFPGPLRYLEEVSIGSLLVPYPQYGQLQEKLTPGRKSIYQSLLLRLQRQFSKGASVLASYGYNRERDLQFFNDIDTYDGRFTYIPNYLPRHRLNVSGSYDMPLGRGRQYFPNMNPVLNAIVGGWSTSGIFSWTSGSFARFDNAIVMGDPLKDVPAGYYWNPNFLAHAPAFTLRTNPWQYAGVTGPSYWNIDATLSKFFPLKGDRLRLEFKMEAYNLTNSLIPSFPYTDIGSEFMGYSDGQANRGRELQYTIRMHF
jgi:hypothetical protein